MIGDEIIPKEVTSEREKTTKKRTTTTTNKTNNFAVDNSHDDSSLIQVKILYVHNDANHRHKCDINDNNERLLKGQTLLTSYFHPYQKTTNVLNHDYMGVSIDVEEHSGSTVKDLATTEKKYLSRQIRRKYKNLKICKYFIRRRTKNFLVQLISKARKKFSPRWHRFQRNNNLSFVYRCIFTYHLFTTEFINQRENKVATVPAKMTTEAIVTNRRVQKILSDSASSHEENTTVHTVSQNDAGNKRLPKNQRINDSTRLLLLSEHAQESSEKDFCKVSSFQSESKTFM